MIVMKAGNLVPQIANSLCIGSNLVNLNREPKDYDFIASERDVQTFLSDKSVVHVKDNRWGKTYFVEGYKPIEVELTELSPTGAELLKLVKKGDISDANLVHMLKMSHRYLRNSPSFLKTMVDIKSLRKRYWTMIPKQYQDWFKRREKQTYDYAHPSLKQDKKSFFTDNVKYVYDHDSVHESVALTVPAYTMYAKVGEEVLSDKMMFFDADESVRLSGVVEEACVLALERFTIPNDTWNLMPNKTFLMALEKVCTSITSGWFREYAWEHYDRVVAYYLKHYSDYESKFIKNLRNGKVKKYEQKDNN